MCSNENTMNQTRWCGIPNNEIERVQNEEQLFEWYNTENLFNVIHKITNENLQRRFQHDDILLFGDEVGIAFCDHINADDQLFGDFSEEDKVWTSAFKEWFTDICKEIMQKKNKKKDFVKKMVDDNENKRKRIAELEARIEELEWSPEPGPKYKALHSCQTRFKAIKLEKQ